MFDRLKSVEMSERARLVWEKVVKCGNVQHSVKLVSSQAS